MSHLVRSVIPLSSSPEHVNLIVIFSTLATSLASASASTTVTMTIDTIASTTCAVASSAPASSHLPSLPFPLPAASCFLHNQLMPRHDFNKHCRPNAIQAATTLPPIITKYMEENGTLVLIPDHLLATHQHALPILLPLATNIHT
ncbi:hypothetical protein C8R48DRAFT_778696 [Suillus tomentosus]|nr:hypothetical protein C8R48DRAFT_778696 [Suillus tomentosus]